MRQQFPTAALLFALCAGMIISRSHAADSEPWATGAAIGQQLAVPVSVSWTNLPLARALKSLAKAQHVAIVLDRRVDPERPITLAIDQEPLGEALEKIAGHLTLGYCQFGPVAYFGPPTIAKRLRTLAALRLDELRQLPTPVTRKLLMMRSSHWEDLTEPKQLLEDLAAEAGVEILGIDKIPHDLWPAADLPPLSWIDRLTLIAAQFDLSFELDKAGRKAIRRRARQCRSGSQLPGGRRCRRRGPSLGQGFAQCPCGGRQEPDSHRGARRGS